MTALVPLLRGQKPKKCSSLCLLCLCGRKFLRGLRALRGCFRLDCLRCLGSPLDPSPDAGFVIDVIHAEFSLEIPFLSIDYSALDDYQNKWQQQKRPQRVEVQ